METGKIAMEWISVKDRLPEDKGSVLATVKEDNGEKYVWADVRFNRDMSDYKEDFRKKHPNGVWEWAYEAGADYWEDVRGEVTHWMPYPKPAD